MAPEYSLQEHLRIRLRPLSARMFPSDKEVHAVRKEIKRSRAALRLLRGAVGERKFGQENRRLRDAGRSLAPIRDAATLLKALGKIERPDDDRSVREYCAHLRGLLMDQRAEARRHLGRESIQRCVRVLSDSALDIKPQAARIPALRSVGSGLCRVYRAGRRSMRRARKDKADAAWHEWRKQANYLANEAELAGLMYRVKFRRVLDDAKRLADLLGKHHDLAVMEYKSREAGTRRVVGAIPPVLQKRIRRAQRRLRAKIDPVGRTLYGLQTRGFGRWARRKLQQR